MSGHLNDQARLADAGLADDEMRPTGAAGRLVHCFEEPAPLLVPAYEVAPRRGGSRPAGAGPSGQGGQGDGDVAVWLRVGHHGAMDVRLQDSHHPPGPITGLGSHPAPAAELPASIPEVREVVQGLLVHASWAERYGAGFLPPPHLVTP